MVYKELVLEYWDKNGASKGVVVNEFRDGIWVIDFTNNTCTEPEDSLKTILEDIYFNAGIGIADWFYDSLVEFCEQEIQESGTNDMKRILDELNSI